MPAEGRAQQNSGLAKGNNATLEVGINIGNKTNKDKRLSQIMVKKT
jgi:hypothetical protein